MKSLHMPFRQPQRHGVKEIKRLEQSSASAVYILQEKGSIDRRPVSFAGLTRYALPQDRILHVIGVMFCMIAGTALVKLTTQYPHDKLIRYHSR